MTESINNIDNAVEITPANTTIAVSNEVDFAAMVERSANMGEMKPLITLTAEYIELEKPSEFFDGIFIGFQEMNLTDKQTGEQKSLSAARFLIDKQVKINAGAVLVAELNRAKISVGTPLRVTYLRKEGNTKLYTLTLLG
mgnify:CR=1 FL=1|jgi:hypothetical protein